MRTIGEKEVRPDAGVETRLYVQRPIMCSGASAGHVSAAQRTIDPMGPSHNRPARERLPSARATR